MSYSQNNFKKVQLKVRGDFVEVFHCLRNLDDALSGLDRQVNKRGFFVYPIVELEKINKIFEKNGIPEEEIFLSDDKKIVFNDKENAPDQNLIFYKFVNNNVSLKFRYDKVIIDMIKMSKFRRWHNDTKLWEISVNDFEKLKQDVEQIGYKCVENISRPQTPQKRPLSEEQAIKVHNAPSKAMKVQGSDQKRIREIPESLKRWPQSQFFKSMLPESSEEEDEPIPSTL